MTLCTARLNIGSTRFFAAPLVDVVFEDRLDLREDDRLNPAPLLLPIVISRSSAERRVGLSVDWFVFDPGVGDDWLESEVVSTDGRSMSALVGVVGPEPVISVEYEADRKDTPDTERSRGRVSLTTSCIWRLSGFFDEVGGGRTMM